MLLSGCASTPVAPAAGGVTPTVEAELARDFTLGPGQAASIEGTGIAILFRSVSADSRCPVDVQCIWAGDAAVVLTISSGSPREERDTTLHTTLDPKAVLLGSYEVRLMGVAPAPRSGSPIAPASYRVTLRVTRLP